MQRFRHHPVRVGGVTEDADLFDPNDQFPFHLRKVGGFVDCVPVQRGLLQDLLHFAEHLVSEIALGVPENERNEAVLYQGTSDPS